MRCKCTHRVGGGTEGWMVIKLNDKSESLGINNDLRLCLRTKKSKKN